MRSMGHHFELEPVDGVVVVRMGDEVLARSSRAVRLREYNRGEAMPPVLYLPPEDVPVERWTQSGLTTGCPIKGKCEYWTIEAGGERKANVAWSYTQVVAGAEDIARWVAFDRARLAIEVEPAGAS